MYPNGNSHESNLQRSWHDSSWIPHLNSSNVLNYFCERTNPFFERTCNNETLRMQNASYEKLRDMTGMEYMLLHAQEPILYVIRYQLRESPNHVIPKAEYYIIAGVVYQAPDLNSVISSRLSNAINSLGSAFTEAQSYSRYHPSRGYWWEFKDQNNQVEKNKTKEKPVPEYGSQFQRERVDALLFDFEQRFGIRKPALPEKIEDIVKVEKQDKETPTNQNSSTSDRPTPGVNIKQEKKMKPLR